MIDAIQRDLGPPPPAPPIPKPRAPSSTGLPAAKPRAISSVTAPPRATSAASRPAPVVIDAAPTAADNELPQLENDGVTLRFASLNQYRVQHKANIAHGGIIVRSAPLAIGTQKFLVLLIPGRERYTVSARVTFIGDGTIGFVIDSFPMHKTQLKSLAD
jgi:hypothetical protein